MSTRPAPERVYDTVREALFCVARFTPGLTLTAVAAKVGCSEKKLADRTSRQRPDADTIEAVTLATGNFAIIRTLCRRIGMLAVPIPTCDSKPADVLAGVADISREYSDAMSALTECLDGSTEQQRLDAVQQLTELLERASALRAHLQAARPVRPLSVQR